jgi:hypothetical protein
MKRALVLGLIVLFGCGIASFGQLSGYWSTSIGIDPDAAVLPAFFTSLNSTLKVDYALSDWTFGAISTFDKAGFASQKFSVAGALGAFTFASGMAFDPAAITEKTYTAYDATDLTAMFDTPLQTDSLVGYCPLTWSATEVGPRFLTWDVTAAVSIAGVSFEAYVLQDYSHYNVKNVNYLWDMTGTAVQTDSMSWNTTANGMGWRLKVVGSFGAVNVTSLTYFNLTETTNAYEAYSGLHIGKSGEISVLTGCAFPFVEEYLTIEGFTFGCATIDIGISILCTGFNDITFLVSDISLGGWAMFDFAITFGTDSKTVDTSITLVTPVFDCFVVEMGFGSGAWGEITTNVISDIYVHGFKLVQTFAGIKFTSITELDKASLLMSGYSDYAYLSGGEQLGFLSPFFGKALVGGDATTPVYNVIADKLYMSNCVATERYQLWEKFVIDVDADACCGGLFDLTVATFFGNHEELVWAGYAVYTTASTTGTVTTLYGLDADKYAYGTSTVTRDTASFKTVYKADTEVTLFDWAKTSVDLGVGIGTNIGLTFGFDISAFGWESLDVGFKWSF